MRNEHSDKYTPPPPLCPSCAKTMRLARTTWRFENPTVIPMNVALVVCRTSTPGGSRQHERAQPYDAQIEPRSNSDLVNLSRAKDAAIAIAQSDLNALDERDAPAKRADRRHRQAA